jgi:hypothetical protein
VRAVEVTFNSRGAVDMLRPQQCTLVNAAFQDARMKSLVIDVFSQHLLISNTAGQLV